MASDRLWRSVGGASDRPDGCAGALDEHAPRMVIATSKMTAYRSECISMSPIVACPLTASRCPMLVPRPFHGSGRVLVKRAVSHDFSALGNPGTLVQDQTMEEAVTGWWRHERLAILLAMTAILT